MRALSFAAIVLWASLAHAQSVTLPATISGAPGDFIVVAATTDDTTVKWLSVDSRLKLFPVHLLKDSKSAVVISLTPGTYRLIAVSAKGDVPSDFAECLVTVGTAPNPPDPEPDPEPDPPTPTPSRYGFDRDARTWASLIAAGPRKLAAGLADNFDAVASQIAAGAFPDVNSANADLRTRNRQALGTEAESWRGWFSQWAEKAGKLNASGELGTLAEYQEAFEETAAGLKAVK